MDKELKWIHSIFFFVYSNCNFSDYKDIYIHIRYMLVQFVWDHEISCLVDVVFVFIVYISPSFHRTCWVFNAESEIERKAVHSVRVCSLHTLLSAQFLSRSNNNKNEQRQKNYNERKARKIRERKDLELPRIILNARQR